MSFRCGWRVAASACMYYVWMLQRIYIEQFLQQRLMNDNDDAHGGDRSIIMTTNTNNDTNNTNNNNNKRCCRRRRHRRLDLNQIPHCGRDAELALLWKGLEQAKQGISSGILMEAASGFGKTALLDTFVANVTNACADADADAAACAEERRIISIQQQQQQQQPPDTTTTNNNNTKAVVVCRGKFEERTAALSEPFGAIRDATKALFCTSRIRRPRDDDDDDDNSDDDNNENHHHHSNSSTQEEKQFWKQRIQEAVDLDMELIEDILPDVLLPCLDDNDDHDDDNETHDDKTKNDESGEDKDDNMSVVSSIDFEAFGNMSDKEWRFERFRLAFRALFRCVCSCRTVVFILDDMHWADPDSISLIKTLLEDKDTRQNFLFVGATRPIKHFKLLAELLTKEVSVRLQIITLKPFSVQDVACLLSKVLGQCNENDLFALAETIQLKTGGNAFVVVQFLRLLEEKNLIFYSPENSVWSWDGARINAEATISDNVAQVVADKLETLDTSRKKALMTAAAFGTSHFEVTTIVHAMSVLENTDDTKESQDCTDPYFVQEKSQLLRSILAKAEGDGLVQEMGPDRFRFTHDRIREAAYSLLPAGDARKLIHLGIGRHLRQWMDAQEERGAESALKKEALVFHATKQLNLGADLIYDTWEKLDLADLNYHAAELAAKRASFHSSMEYLQAGRSHLDENSWHEHYQITLKLTVALTRMQYCCGLFGECIESADRVVEHAKTFLDKQPVVHTKILCLLQQERQYEATILTLDIMDHLGQPFPRRLLLYNAWRSYQKSKGLLLDLTDEDILALPEASDMNVHYSMPFMERLAELSFLGGNPAYVALVTTHMTQAMVERGHFGLSGLGLGLWGWFHAQKGAFDEGIRYGRLALRIFDERGDIPKEGVRMKILFWFFTAHWRLPIVDGLEPISTALKQLWHMGALDYYHMAGYTLHRSMFACGEPLQVLLHDCKKYSESLLDFKHLLVWNISAPLHQAILNFMGLSRDPRILIGDHMNVEVLQPEWKRSGNKMALFQSQLFGMIVAYYFNDFELAARNADQIRQALFEDGPELMVTFRMFYTGLVYLACYRTTGKRKYKRKTQPILKQFRKWVEGGAVNCDHMDLLLQAELSSLSSMPVETVTESYKQAITAAATSGMRPHHALANELAAAFLCRESDSLKARPLVEKARDLYSEWGAVAKVNDIETRYKNVLNC